jgi:hypothetical protein
VPHISLVFREIWDSTAQSLRLPTTVHGSGRVPHVRPSVHGPKTGLFQCFPLILLTPEFRNLGQVNSLGEITTKLVFRQQLLYFSLHAPKVRLTLVLIADASLSIDQKRDWEPKDTSI